MTAEKKFQEQMQSLWLARNKGEAMQLIENSETKNAEIKLWKARWLGLYGDYAGKTDLLNEASGILDEIDSDTSELTADFLCELLLLKSKIHLHQGQIDKSREALDRCLQIALKIGPKQLSAIQLANIYLSSNDFDKARKSMALLDVEEMDIATKLAYYNQWCKICLKEQDYEHLKYYSENLLALSETHADAENNIIARNAIAVIQGFQNEFKDAMLQFLEALSLSEKIGFRKQSAIILLNIGTIYAHLFNHQKALQRYREVTIEYQDLLKANTLIVVENNIGNLYLSDGKRNEALESFQRAGKEAIKVGYKEMVALAKVQEVRTFLELKSEKAKYLNTECVEIFKEKEYSQSWPIHLVNQAEINLLDHKYEEAGKYASLGIVASKKQNDHVAELRGYRLLAKTYSRTDQWQKALDAMQLELEANNSYQTLLRDRQVIDIEIQNALGAQKLRIEQLMRENEYQAKLLDQSQQIEFQNLQLKQANDDLRQFAYITSHDLKEPLRMIGSFSQLIHRDLKEKLESNTELYFNFVQNGVIRMNVLLDALLEYATVGKHLDIATRINMQEEISSFLLPLQSIINEKKAEIHAEKLPTVFVRRSLLDQLIQNLLSNAIKFVPPDKIPEIHIYAEPADIGWKISVKDNGIGIEPKQHERIFELFQRLHKSADYDGTGIGLAICQKIVRDWGGKIGVESQLGEGATVWFTIPAEG